MKTQQLLHSACKTAIDLAKWADSKVPDGTITRNRLVAPNASAVFSWISRPFSGPSSSIAPSSDASESFGSATQGGRDPEHLPPTNAVQRLGDRLRKTSNILRSPHATFAIRIACAVLCTQILGYLHRTQRWFNVERVFWASITVSDWEDIRSG